MTQDARFEDGAEQPIRLKAEDTDDLQVISALVQDAVFPITEMTWAARQMRFAVLLNRFRWEDEDKATQQGRDFERVQTVLAFEGVCGVASSGIDRDDKDTILSVLGINWEPGEDADGVVTLVLAGDGAIKLNVECLEATLRDVTRPYVAPSKSMPAHDLD